MQQLLATLILTLTLLSSASYGKDYSSVTEEWQSYVEPMLPMADHLAALMADTDDPQLRHEMYQLLFSGLSTAYMGLFLGDADHPDFWPAFNQAYNFGTPNPDLTYILAPIEGDGIYKISGFRGTRLIVNMEIATGILSEGTLAPIAAQYDLDDLSIDEDGAFDIILSAERPDNYKGNWLKLDEKATNILLRQISYDWLNEVDGRFAIERLDSPAIRPRLSASEIDAKLKTMVEWAENMSILGPKWLKPFREKGLINEAIDQFSNIGGLSTQHYVEGLFDVGIDEALIYEVDLPKECRYWSIALNDMLWRTIDYMNRQISLNGHTARIDKDGKFRAVISATDPGVPNWLDSAGYTKGSIAARWLECSSTPIPTITRIKVADIRKHLPADTPIVTDEQRDREIRLRRKGMQLRRRW